jgi:hypothetical protein
MQVQRWATTSQQRQLSTTESVEINTAVKYEPVYTQLSTKCVQSGESGGRVSMQDCLTTPIAQTSAYTFKNTQQLIDFCEDRFKSYEYGRYGNPTTKALENKICHMEAGEDALFSASGMNTTTCSMLALLPPTGHLMILKGGYRETDKFAKNFLGNKMGNKPTKTPLMTQITLPLMSSFLNTSTTQVARSRRSAMIWARSACAKRSWRRNLTFFTARALRALSYACSTSRRSPQPAKRPVPSSSLMRPSPRR